MGPDQPPQFATPGEATIKMAAGNLYTTDNPVFASFCFYAALVALKMLMMSFLTAYHRLTKFSPILKMQPCRKLKCERTNPSKELEGRISTIWKTSCHSSSSA